MTMSKFEIATAWKDVQYFRKNGKWKGGVPVWATRVAKESSINVFNPYLQFIVAELEIERLQSKVAHFERIEEAWWTYWGYEEGPYDALHYTSNNEEFKKLVGVMDSAFRSNED